jgi:hypothetical protein
MRDVVANLVSEDGAHGVLGVGDESTFHAHMKDCHFHVDGANGIGIEVLGKMSVPGCEFHGDSIDVLCVAPETDNIMRYDSATSFDSVTAGGGFERMSYFDHSLRSLTVYVDDLYGDDILGFESDQSRPFKTIANALSHAAFVGAEIVDVAPGIYSEIVVVPAGILLLAPNSTIDKVILSGSRARIGKLSAQAGDSGLAFGAGVGYADIDEIELAGNSAIGIAGSGAGELIGRIGRIVETGSPTTTKGIELAGTSKAKLFVNELNADTAYDVPAGTEIDLFVGDLTGTETVGGTVNVTKAGSVAGLSGLLADPQTPGAVVVSAEASTPVAVAAADAGKVYTNEGAAAQINFNLPTALAGLIYDFIVQDSDGIQVNANTGDTIRDQATVSAGAGNIASTTVGDTLRLICINATEWIAAPAIGTWTVT